MVPLHPVQELLPTFRVPDVLHAQVDALLDISVPDDFVYDDADGVRCNVVDNACSARTTKFDQNFGRRCQRGRERTRDSICEACPFVVRRWL